MKISNATFLLSLLAPIMATMAARTGSQHPPRAEPVGPPRQQAVNEIPVDIPMADTAGPPRENRLPVGPPRQATNDIPVDIPVADTASRNVPPVTDTVEGILTFVIWLKDDEGLDNKQIMGLLHAKGYTNERLSQIFQGHEEENDELNRLFENV